ncbi:MAG: class I SAM-dependent methyltransferase [Acutalibacteraceae bacterium]|nr:class I SAM-dependent methyltransferase [Acutalibacteraceae bacterium]
MYTLSERLKVIADKITGGRVADIGTDHAYLPIYLIKTGKASRVLACDIKEKPLQNAAKNIQKTNTKNIELRLSDGLAGVGADEADTIVIAGMGGEVIAGILNRCNWIKNAGYKLLLQPMTSADFLRQFLLDNGFFIESETAVLDAGKLYTVISCAFSGEKQTVSDAFIFTGRLDPKEPTARLYIEKQLKRLRKCQNNLENIETEKDKYFYYKNIADDITKLLGGN